MWSGPGAFAGSSLFNEYHGWNNQDVVLMSKHSNLTATLSRLSMTEIDYSEHKPYTSHQCKHFLHHLVVQLHCYPFFLS